MSDEAIIMGFTQAEWEAMPWWPKGRQARVMAGYAGHDREITVNIDGYNGAYENENILEWVEAVIVHHLPSEWLVENRGSRLDLHPSGSFAGGFNADDIQIAFHALKAAGFVPELRT